MAKAGAQPPGGSLSEGHGPVAEDEAAEDERTRHRDHGGMRRICRKRRGVATLARALSADAADDPRHRRGTAIGADHRADIHDVDTIERQSEIVGIAFAPYFAAADDVDA